MFATLCGSLGAITFLEFLKSAVFLLGYISNNNLFPEPLSAEEERKYLELMKRGDEEARNILIERNLRLVAHICKKYSTAKAEQEDLISIGTIGLIKAVNTFNPNKNIKLATYASRCIENEILMYLRKTAQQRNEISIDEPLNIDWDGNELLLSDVIGTDPDAVGERIESEAEKMLLIKAVNSLKGRERMIMQMRFGLNGGHEMTQKEVADVVGISQSYISRLEKRILKELKKELEAIY